MRKAHRVGPLWDTAIPERQGTTEGGDGRQRFADYVMPAILWTGGNSKIKETAAAAEA